MRKIIYQFKGFELMICTEECEITCGQSYKASTIVNYDSRVVIYDRRGFIRLATELNLWTKDSCF